MAITDDARKRAEAVNELIYTEQRYLQRIQVLKTIFEVPSEMVISPEERRVVFQNLDDLVSTSTTMLDRLKQSQLENCDCVGSKFLESVAELEVLKFYCINHSKANKRFHELMKGNKKFARLVKEGSENPECESLQMVSFLLEPVQRLTRYPLLLRQILHYTPKDHPDHNSITEGLLKSETILRDTNEAVRALENIEKLEEIQAKLLKGTGRFHMGLSSIFGSSRPSSASSDKIGFDLTGQCIEGGQRWFCHSGKGSVSRKDLEIFLFNDIMLIARPHMGSAFELVGQPIQVQLIETIKQGPLEITFTGKEFAALTVKFEDEDETETWLHEVKQAQKKLRASKSKMFIKPALVHFIGSMEVSVLEFTQPKAKMAVPVVCNFKLGFYEATSEETKTGTVREKIIIPIAHFHEDLEITLVQTVKLSPKIQVAICRLPLDFLEYYQNKETDEMGLAMSCPKTGNRIGSIKLKIFYKVF